MNATAPFALAAAGLIGLGLYGMLAQSSVLRKVIAFNLLGVGVFLVFGVVALLYAIILFFELSPIDKGRDR